jgi:integrase
LAARAGVPVIRFHDLRHTSASLGLLAGVSVKATSSRVGHSSSWFTADRYVQVLDAVARDAADRMAEVVSLTAHRERRASAVTASGGDVTAL